MSETIYLVLHRKSANEPYVKEAVKAVRKEGIELRVLVPFNKAEKPRIVNEALERGATRIIAGGGDGTINAVTNALVRQTGEDRSATLGILPLGTANDFARGCGLPVDNLTECLKIACTREGRPTDVGVMNKRYFINVASMGFGAEIVKPSDKSIGEMVMGEVKRTFNPEFINRIDEIIIFHTLTREQVQQIVDLQITEIAGRLTEHGITIELTDDQIIEALILIFKKAHKGAPRRMIGWSGCSWGSES